MTEERLSAADREFLHGHSYTYAYDTARFYSDDAERYATWVIARYGDVPTMAEVDEHPRMVRQFLEEHPECDPRQGWSYLDQ